MCRKMPEPIKVARLNVARWRYLHMQGILLEALARTLSLHEATRQGSRLRSKSQRHATCHACSDKWARYPASKCSPSFQKSTIRFPRGRVCRSLRFWHMTEATANQWHPLSISLPLSSQIPINPAEGHSHAKRKCPFGSAAACICRFAPPWNHRHAYFNRVLDICGWSTDDDRLDAFR